MSWLWILVGIGIAAPLWMPALVGLMLWWFKRQDRKWWREVGQPCIDATEALLGMHYNPRTHQWSVTEFLSARKETQ